MSRADLVIFDRPVEGEEDYFDQCKSIIEVKRVQSAKKRIDKDLKRLAEAQKFSCDETRTFLVLVSQSQRPSRFTTKDGNARKGDLKIEDTNKNIGFEGHVKQHQVSRELILRTMDAYLKCLDNLHNLFYN